MNKVEITQNQVDDDDEEVEEVEEIEEDDEEDDETEDEYGYTHSKSSYCLCHFNIVTEI